MEFKNRIHQLMASHNISSTDLISAHIENYPFKKETVIVFTDHMIKVMTKSPNNMCYLMTITNDSHVCTEIIPLRK